MSNYRNFDLFSGILCCALLALAGCAPKKLPDREEARPNSEPEISQAQDYSDTHGRDTIGIVCVSVSAHDEAFRGNGPDISSGLSHLLADRLRSELASGAIKATVFSVLSGGFPPPAQCRDEAVTAFSLDYSMRPDGRIVRLTTFASPPLGVASDEVSDVLPKGWEHKDTGDGHIFNPVQANLSHDVSENAKLLFARLAQK